MDISSKLGFLVDTPSRNLQIQEDKNKVEKEIGAIIKGHRDSIVRSKHYSFINFEKYGVRWTPDWFSMVRHPVDRVSL